MTSLLDDVKRMLKNGYGDSSRLNQIKETLEQNKMLFVSERKYLVKLTRDHPDNTETKNYQLDKSQQKHTPDRDLDIEELEDKIKVESEPS